MVKFFNTIGQYILYASIIANVILIYEIYTLPKKISMAINAPKECGAKDTIIKTVTANLQNQNEFIYFEGKIIKDAVKANTWIFNVNIPDELYEGYFYLARSNEGGEYFLWSQNEKFKPNFKIKGWFVAAGGTWQEGKKYIHSLFPIMPKKSFSSDFGN